MAKASAEQIAQAERLVLLFRERRSKVQSLLDQVRSMIEPEMEEGGRLFGLVHSTKGRLKDEKNLQEKIIRKIEEGIDTGTPYEISEENFFSKITDLAAYRIMHLYPRQMQVIHPVLMQIFHEKQIPHWETPAARVWDLETEKFYRDVVGLRTIHTTEKLYSSVHYVLLSNWTTKYTCEIQVRTLADEVWGEVDHSINYPKRSKSIACREQIKSLAHLTTSCNRLADSIFASHQEWESNEAQAVQISESKASTS